LIFKRAIELAEAQYRLNRGTITVEEVHRASMLKPDRRLFVYMCEEHYEAMQEMREIACN
jgi:hypothetical protein